MANKAYRRSPSCSLVQWRFRGAFAERLPRRARDSQRQSPPPGHLWWQHSPHRSPTNPHSFQNEAATPQEHIITDPYFLTCSQISVMLRRTVRGIHGVQIGVNSRRFCPNKTATPMATNRAAYIVVSLMRTLDPIRIVALDRPEEPWPRRESPTPHHDRRQCESEGDTSGPYCYSINNSEASQNGVSPTHPVL